MKKIIIAAGLGVAALALTACGQAPWESQMHDFENATIKDPSSVTVFNNVDQHPNIARVCADGVAFATTTREGVDILRVPEWDALCS